MTQLANSHSSDSTDTLPLEARQGLINRGSIHDANPLEGPIFDPSQQKLTVTGGILKPIFNQVGEGMTHKQSG